MSIRTRLEDARLLAEHLHWEGALLSVLVAIAATARRRFPLSTPSRAHPRKTMGDAEAFKTFAAEALSRVIVGPEPTVTFQGAVRPLSEVLYTWMRCTLAHEAELPPDLRFAPDYVAGSVGINTRPGPPEHIEVTHSLVVMLADLVAQAPENSDVPARLREQLVELRHQGARGPIPGLVAAQPAGELLRRSGPFDPPAVELLEGYLRAVHAGLFADLATPLTESQTYQVEHVATKARRELADGVPGQYTQAEAELLSSIGKDLLLSSVVSDNDADRALRANIGSGVQEVGLSILSRIAASAA